MDTFIDLVDLCVERDLQPFIDSLILLRSVFFEAQTYSQLAIQLINVLSIFVFSFVIAFLSSPEVFLYFLVFIDLGVQEY